MNNQHSTQPVQPVAVTLMLSKLVLLALTTLSGMAGFIYFNYVGNYYAAGACFKMEFASYYVIRLNSIAIDGKLKEKYSACELWCVFVTAIVVGIVSYVGAVGYAALGGIYNQGFQMENDGYYVCIIPCTMALFWSMVLAVDSRSYMKDLRESQEDREALHRTNLRRF